MAITMQLKNKFGLNLYKCIWSTILTSLRHASIMQLRCKNKKLQNLIAPNQRNWTVIKLLIHPVINLSTENLDMEPLKCGLHHSYIDENKHVKTIRVIIHKFR